jgi:dihydrofolate synthase/folylpolyglutamate synthase
MRFESLPAWLEWLESFHPTEIDLGLDRVGVVANSLGLRYNDASCCDDDYTGEYNSDNRLRPKVITIAGTNGKGSCVTVLNHLLTQSGFRVGSYTSPHLLRYNERISIDGEPVDDPMIVDAFERIDQARGLLSLTYFEFSTLAALDIFQYAQVDVVLLEVGLGGRLDAVNIVDADIAIVTSIDIDHVDWLGSDRESIGFEKAGIFRKNRVAICADLNPPQSLIDVAQSLSTQLLLNGRDFKWLDQGITSSWQGVNVEQKTITLNNLSLPLLPLGSIAAALQAFQLLPSFFAKKNKQLFVDQLDSLAFAGRFQSVNVAGRKVILDVAHNPAAALSLANNLSQLKISGHCLALCAMMKDKDAEGVVDALSKSFDRWFVADLLGNPRAQSASSLAEVIIQSSGITSVGVDSVDISTVKNGLVSIFSMIEAALFDALSSMTENDCLVVFGSFFTVAETLELINNKQRNSLAKLNVI